MSRPVGGVLFRPLAGAVGGHPSVRPTWGLHPKVRAGQPSPAWPCSGWGLPSRPGHPGRWCALTAPFHPYLCRPVARPAIGGLFSVALSCGSPRLAVSQHPALRSPDLPRPGHRGVAPRPPGRLTVVSSVPAALARGDRESAAATVKCAAVARRARARQRRCYTYEAEPTARVTLPNGDGNSCSSGMSDVRMIEWRRSTAPTDCTVWRSSRVVNIDANT